MKKVYTDPRILTGQKGAASLTQWYDDELSDVAPSPHSRLNGSGSLDMSHGSVNLHDMSESVFNSPPWNGNLASGVTANIQVCDAAYESSERENLVAKINKLNDQLQSEQKSQQCNVNEYLELSQSIAVKDRGAAQAQRVKAAFERRNQKSTAAIQQLQRKLETYKERLKALDAAVTVPNGGMVGGSPWPAIGMLRGIRTITKPKAFAYMLRKQFGSADNISTIKSMEDEAVPDDSVEPPGRIHSTLPASFRCHSDEDLAKLSSSPASSALAAAMSLASPTAMLVSPPNSRPRTATETRAGQSAAPQAFTFPGTAGERSWQQQRDERRSSSASQSQESTVVMTTYLLQLQHIQESYKERQKEVELIKKKIASDQSRCRELLDEQHERSEHLIDRLNDMTDLHQSELTTIKQELSMFEEKLAYQLDERVRDMQEMVDSCHNRLARLEAAQRNSVEGVNNTGVRASVVKLINVALSILALLLVLVGFVVKLLGPFFSSRTRAISTAVVVALLAATWFGWSLRASN